MGAEELVPGNGHGAVASEAGNEVVYAAVAE
jgi:hypothetical protein